MKPMRYHPFAFLASLFFFSIQISYAETFTVSKTGGAGFTTVQAAVDAAGPGDIVKILDAATYAEQVTIDSTKNGLTLTSSDPASQNKPKIVWQDKINAGPQTCAEAQIDSLITYDMNGTLRLMRVHDVTVSGLAIDGGGSYAFGSSEPVWPMSGGSRTFCRYYLFHGNTGLLLYMSGNAIIRNCSVQNAYFGVYIKDRNQGGIFANANPGDNAPWDVVPFSGFGRTGNHLIEQNRIHNNSWGFFIESAWDLGFTIRYNLIYENHHVTDSFAAQVKSINSEGSNQPGGAILFKDDMLCPVSIYNNTFWRNYLLIVGGWQPGFQHLIFNNIFARPFRYWTDDPVFRSTEYMDISYRFPNRLTNCIYSCQYQAPDFYCMIMSSFPYPQRVVNQPPVPGAMLASTYANTPFPAAANVRWLEMDSTRFISVDPASPDFLKPIWDDSLVQTYVKNQGWQPSGVKNPDGSWADLGAVPSSGGLPQVVATIKPIMPVTLDSAGTNATIRFDVSERIGTVVNPAFKLFRWVGNIKAVTGSWAGGASEAIITTANMSDIPIPAAPVLKGANTYTVSLPVAQTTPYAFFEAVFEVTGSDGKVYTSSTGFLPYRKRSFKFRIELFATDDTASSRPLTQVRAGDSLRLRVSPLTATDSAYAKLVKPVIVSLQSGSSLFSTEKPNLPVSFANGITGPTDTMVYFSRVPGNGIEYVVASGKSDTGIATVTFLGYSAAIRILSAPAKTVVFQGPPSKTLGRAIPTLNPGQPYAGTLNVYDRFYNKVTFPTSVRLRTLTPLTVLLAGPDTLITTDSSGVGKFRIQTTSSAAINSQILLQALLPTNNACDTAEMMIGAMTMARKPSDIPDALSRLLTQEVRVVCFDLQGRMLFSRTFMSSPSLPLTSKSLLGRNTVVGSKVFLMEVRVRDGLSRKQTRFIRKAFD
jgi:hypothetical protein